MGKDLKGKELGAGYSQRADGKYRRSFRFNGKQTAVYGSTLKECKQKYLDTIKSIDEGVYSSSRKPTMDAYKDEWIKGRKLSRKNKDSTLNHYHVLYKHISAEFGKMRIDQIKPTHIKAFQRKLSDSLKPKTVNDIIGLMQNILETAVEDELIIRNPCAVVRALSNTEDDERNNARALTDDELKLFLEFAEDSFYFNAIRLLFATGMRSGELRGLMWSDYDTKQNVLHIRRTASVDEAGKLTMNSPKSKSGKRDIPLTEQIKAIIEEQKKQQMMLEVGSIRKIDDYIFKSVHGKVISRNVLKSDFDRICRNITKSGFEFNKISPHATRHTFITNALHQGMNEYLLKDIVGHSPSAKVTTDKYLDRNQDEINKAMQEFKMAL